MSDEALIEAIQQGEGDAAACLYHRHIDRVHRICYRIVLDRAQAPDCVQEVWLKVFRNIGRFRCERSFAIWLNSVAANTAIDYYRRGRRQGNRVDLETCMESFMSEEGVRDRELDDAITQRRIHDALEEISIKQRTAFVLRYFEGMPLSEVARLLGCRKGTVRTHIHRCLVALREKLAMKLDQ